MGIKVIAIEKGFYAGKLRHPADEEERRKASTFEIQKESEFSSVWMEKVDSGRNTLSMKKGA